MKIIGLTGGIGSGKSMVANCFAHLGVPIIDADIIAHQLVEKGMPALEQIIQIFGKTIVDKQGNLNRTKMRTLVFTQDADNNPFKQKLESILHPVIYETIKKQIDILKNKNPTAPYCIVVVPLLMEKWSVFKNIIDQVVLVDVPQALQLSRLLKRNITNPSSQIQSKPLSKQQALLIIENQMKRTERLKMADIVLPNVGSLETLYQDINRLHTLWHNA